MTTEEKAKAYDEALRRAKELIAQWTGKNKDFYTEDYSYIFPELAESEDEKVRKTLINIVKGACDQYGIKYRGNISEEKLLAYLEKKEQTEELVYRMNGLMQEYVKSGKDEEEQEHRLKCYQLFWDALGDSEFFEEKEQKPIKMEVYEIGKETTVCGQDYKCKKDYKAGNCRYIKDAIYHCGRDGYLIDQNGVSWSCTPEWFNEYIQSNTEWAEEEKTRFVNGQFLQCKLSFDGFKEGAHYWLEYIGDDMYVGRSDNILNQKFHITPRQLYTLFSQKLEEVQGPPQEEKQVSLNYEPPFDENPSDNEIIEALIKHLKEQGGFLTAIDCVSTKAILRWLEKQKEQKPEWDEDYNEENIQTRFAFYTYKDDPNVLYLSNVFVEEASRNHGFGTRILMAAEKVAETIGATTIGLKVKQDSSANVWYHKNGYSYVAFEDGYDWLEKNLEYLKPAKSTEWSEEDEKMLNLAIEWAETMSGQFSFVDMNSTDFRKIIAWLKSLRPQPHWKPSEEQMDSLRDTIVQTKGYSYSIYLPELYEQLKKLM